MRDVIFIGSGPGGYNAAERAAAEGLSVLLIEKAELGGVCLNRGCIPTKSLLNSAKLYAHAAHSEAFGVKAASVSFDLATAMAWKDKVVSGLRDGVAATLKRLKVEYLQGEAELAGPGKVRLRGSGEILEAGNVVIATGSSPVMPPIPGAAGNPLVLDSTGMLGITRLPGRLAIIGGGVIGIEFASLFSTLGVKVSVIEMLDEIVPAMDRGLAATLRRALKSVDFRLGSKVEAIDGGKISFSRGGAAESIEADLILMAVGRKPNVEGIGARESGLDAGPAGIAVDEGMRTNLPGVWAIGDVTGKSYLAHSAIRMGEVAIANILGRNEAMRYEAVPWAVYSAPEAAGVGMTEAEARARGLDAVSATASFSSSGRFIAENGLAAPGELKLVADARNGRVLGVQAVGAYASESIWGAAALIEQEMRIVDLRQLIFPHPTVSEVLREAAWRL